MEIRQTKLEHHPAVTAYPAVVESVEGTSLVPNGPLTGLVLVVNDTGRPTRRLFLDGRASESLLRMLLAAKEYAPHLFRE